MAPHILDQSDRNGPHLFLRGGGEMGERIRNFDWTATPLGPPEHWPQSLKTTVSTLLLSRFPMFLLWGPDYIQLYNDAYVPSFGSDGKHPAALGQHGRDCWREAWPLLGPMLDQVQETGEAIWKEDQHVPILRNGRLEDSYWTFSYSPVLDDEGNIGGVLSTCFETTEKVASMRRLVASEAAFQELTDTVPVIIWVTDQDGSCQYLNRTWYDLTGQQKEEALGFGWLKATHPDDVEAAAGTFQSANAARTTFGLLYRLRLRDGSYRWMKDEGVPRFDAHGSYLGMTGTVTDVHEQKLAEERIRESEVRFRTLFEQAPMAVCLWTGPDYLVELANEPMLSMWGKDRSILGKPLREGVPELEGQPFFDILDGIRASGKAYIGSGVPAQLIIDGVKRTNYFDFIYQPLFDASGQVYAIMDMALDVTDRVLSQQHIERTQRELLMLFEQSPVAIAIISREQLTYRMANPFYARIVDRSPEELVGRPLLEAIPEIAGQGFVELLDGVLTTGVPFVSQEVPVRLRRGDELDTIYVNLAYQPMREPDGSISGVLVVATDLTAQVQTRQKIEATANKLNTLIQSAPVAIGLFAGPDFIIETPNEAFIEVIGRGPGIVGKPLAVVMPELEDQPFLQILKDIFTTGKSFRAADSRLIVMKDGRAEERYFNITFSPIFDEHGAVSSILDISVDVTEQVLARKALEESETKLRGIISSAPAGIGLFVGRDLVIENPNQTFIDIVGKGPGIVGMPLREAMPELVTEGQPFLQILDDVFTTGKMFQSPGSLVKIVQNGVMTHNYYNITYTPVFDAEGAVYAILDIAIDVTEQVRTQQALEEAERRLRTAISLSEMGTWTIDLNNRCVLFSDRIAEWYGLPSDSPLEDLMAQVPAGDAAEIAKAVEQAVDPGSDGFFDVEHIIINRHSGQQRIIHAQGIAQRQGGVATGIIEGAASNITIHRELQTELAREVQIRTAELEATNAELAITNNELLRSNEELAQYAYVASHDLQEPLRKIQIFSNMLASGNTLQEKDAALVQRISQSSQRMQLLVKDLLDFSRLLQANELRAAVDLQVIAQEVLQDFELLIQEKGASVRTGKLPAISAIRLQMNQLFYNLIGNALKFTQPGRPPVIEIDARPISTEAVKAYISKPSATANYYHITIADNGIGFAAQYANQIFDVFKRLHTRDAYPGSGIGLALCRRIVANHCGVLYTASEEGKGSVFHILLPDRHDDSDRC